MADITDFLPKYPNVYASEYDVLNPYDDDFYTAILHKKEFYENKLDQTETFPKERGMQTKYQKTIARYMSSHTPYDRLLLVHSMGLGKTCSAIGAIEQIKSEDSNFTGALILAKGSAILENFIKELVEKCTPGQYIPENYAKLSSLEKTHRIKKKIGFYQFRTFIKFKKMIKKMSDSDIIEQYSNKIIVIDEVHNLRVQEESDSIDTYDQYYRFLHLVKNCKVLLLSGTPMKDTPDEIASVANLLLPVEEKLPTGEDFLNDYMNKDGNAYVLKPEKIPELKIKLKGKISFLREPYSKVERTYIGKENYGKLKHFVVYPAKMSDFQSKSYNQAYEKDTSGQTGIYSNSREAALFVYPDGSYGKKGFEKYIKHSKKLGSKKGPIVYTAPELMKILRGENDAETLKNIAKHSATYAAVIENILNTQGNCFIYSSLAQGSGAILFSLLLQLFGFSKANGSEKTEGLRYAILTNKTASTSDIRKISEKFNSKENMYGKIIKVIIGSRAVSEGFSFKNVIFESVNTPHWNYSETAQALARGIRLGSHNDLIAQGINPEVKILQPVAIPSKKYPDAISIDLFMYETSEDKDLSIRKILRLLMEIAFDCALNYLRNFVDGKDGSRECDYVTCKYKCEGVNMRYIEEGIEDKNLDYSTYELYYANTKIPVIRKKIENLFLQNNKLDLESIINNLRTEFSEEEIKNALFTIQEETQGVQYDYRKFLEIYSRSSVKKIMNKISDIFREHFELSIDVIFEYLEEYTKFEILTALKNIINDSIIIINKYGFASYLREENNMYFLVNSLSVSSNFFSVYYTKFPYIFAGMKFTEVNEKLEKNIIPDLVDKLCETKDEKDFAKIIKLLPEPVQEMLIEASVIAEEKGIKKGKIIRQNILNFFKSYVKNIDNTWISTYMKENTQVLRCLEGENFDDWKDCDKRYNELLTRHEEERRQKMKEDNKYGIVGLFNPVNNAFCIVDFKKEEEVKEEAIKNRTKSNDDKRIVHSGKVCGAGGWKLPELMTIAIKRLKIAPPDDFMADVPKEKLLAKLKGESKLVSIFTDEELRKANESTLRRALYWGLSKKDKGNRGIKPICEALKSWFESHGLLEIDDKCGVQGKKKIDKNGKNNRKLFRIADYVALSTSEEFKEYLKELAKIAGDYFGDKKYRIDLNGDKWIVIFLRKKIVGAISSDKKGIKNIFIAKNYKRQGIPNDALSQTFEKYPDLEPTLKIDNKDKNADKNIKMFTKFGFVISKSDGNYTYLKFSGEE